MEDVLEPGSDMIHISGLLITLWAGTLSENTTEFFMYVSYKPCGDVSQNNHYFTQVLLSSNMYTYSRGGKAGWPLKCHNKDFPRTGSVGGKNLRLHTDTDFAFLRHRSEISPVSPWRQLVLFSIHTAEEKNPSSSGERSWAADRSGILSLGQAHSES